MPAESPTVAAVGDSPPVVSVWSRLTGYLPRFRSATTPVAEAAPRDEIEPEAPPEIPPESVIEALTLQGVFEADAVPAEATEPIAASPVTATGAGAAAGLYRGGAAVLDTVRAGLATVTITAIRSVSAERDRDEVLRWFVQARRILAENDSRRATAAALYRTIDTARFAGLIANTLGTVLTNYRTADLPLALKVALPVTAAGAAFFGTQYAGLVAFGSGVGLPVLLLLFLGTAGATTVVEAFVRDQGVRDPLTKLLLAFVALETARRAKKEFLAALRADALLPERAETPPEGAELLAFLRTMDPVAFERHVLSFFARSGRPTGLTPRSNDYGVDGYVLHPDGIVIVQCKRHGPDNPVGRPTVQQFKGVIEEQQAFRGWIVTSGRFTDEARESAAKNPRIRLVDGDDLVGWHLPEPGPPEFD